MGQFKFEVGREYARAEVFEVLGIPDPKGGPFYTGYAEFRGSWFVFCGVGTAGRTGHDYQNRFDDDDLLWYGKTTSAIHQKSIRELIAPGADVYIFYRSEERSPFTFAGNARAKSWQATRPVQITWGFL